MAKDNKLTGSAPKHWIEALERGRADVAAGRVTDIEPLLRELEAEGEELGAERPSRIRPPSAA